MVMMRMWHQILICLKVVLKGLGCIYDSCILSWLNFQATIKFVTLILPKIWFDGFTEPRREWWHQIRKQLLSLIKVLGWKWRLLHSFFSDTWKDRKISNRLCKVDIKKNGGWRSYQATTGKWYEIWIWFEGSAKEVRMQIEILTSVFDWISKQQLNLSLFL